MPAYLPVAKSARSTARHRLALAPVGACAPTSRGLSTLPIMDLAGSGAEDDGPYKTEEHARNELERSDIPPDDVLTACFEPELEKVLGVVWIV